MSVAFMKCESCSGAMKKDPCRLNPSTCGDEYTNIDGLNSNAQIGITMSERGRYGEMKKKPKKIFFER